jgi:hypothetical protein
MLANLLTMSYNLASKISPFFNYLFFEFRLCLNLSLSFRRADRGLNPFDNGVGGWVFFCLIKPIDFTSANKKETADHWYVVGLTYIKFNVLVLLCCITQVFVFFRRVSFISLGRIIDIRIILICALL